MKYGNMKRDNQEVMEKKNLFKDSKGYNLAIIVSIPKNRDKVPSEFIKENRPQQKLLKKMKG